MSKACRSACQPGAAIPGTFFCIRSKKLTFNVLPSASSSARSMSAGPKQATRLFMPCSAPIAICGAYWSMAWPNAVFAPPAR
jgi:hypothetical protein